MSDTDSEIIGTRKILAAPVRAQPRPQLMAAIKSNDQPSDAAARTFSDTAVVAIPNVEYL